MLQLRAKARLQAGKYADLKEALTDHVKKLTEQGLARGIDEKAIQYFVMHECEDACMATPDLNRAISKAKHMLNVDRLVTTTENATDQRRQLQDFGYGRR